MKSIPMLLKGVGLSAVVLLGAASATGQPAHVHHHGAQAPAPSAGGDPTATLTGVSVKNCWIRAMPVHLPSAAYLTLHNDSERVIRLVGVQSETFRHAMLHATKTEGGMARMVHVDVVPVPAGEQFAFATQNGFHVMLEGAREPLREGSVQTLTFVFDQGATLSAECVVKPASALE